MFPPYFFLADMARKPVAKDSKGLCRRGRRHARESQRHGTTAQGSARIASGMTAIFASPQRVQPWHVGRTCPEDEMLDLAYRNSEHNIVIPAPIQPFVPANGECFAVHREVELPRHRRRSILVAQPKVNWLVASDLRIGEDVKKVVDDLINQVEAAHNSNSDVGADTHISAR